MIVALYVIGTIAVLMAVLLGAAVIGYVFGSMAAQDEDDYWMGM